MDQIKSLFNKSSIKTSFGCYIVLCLLAALLFSVVSSSACQFGKKQIYKKYQADFEAEFGNQGKVVLDDGSSVGGSISFYTGNIRLLYSDAERVIDKTLSVLEIVLMPIWFILCIGITSILFYKKRLQKPLEILDYAADNIADNNLDFTVSYEREDELGKLCASFEKMRVALQENNLEMWRQMEDRKRLNAAFSHDLRTPLTVLKGQSEMLLKYVPDKKMTTEKIVATAGTMKAHVTRLENYVYTMNHLQRLEDIEIVKSDEDKAEIIKRLKESGEMICGDKELSFDTNDLARDHQKVDLSVVTQVYENIVSNAVRFAKSKIIVKISDNPYFSITISDDGGGFCEKDLKRATDPFYQSDKNANAQHFGMGLNICKILCEKHGGYLELSNQNAGACVKAVF